MDAFPCENDRQGLPGGKNSFYTPRTVDKLRPGDINVVAGLGDGAVAANGALSTDFIGLGVTYEGVSFATGGKTFFHNRELVQCLRGIFLRNLLKP